MTFPSEVTERKRLCLSHGRVLSVTDKGGLQCPKGPHFVTKWAVSNPLTGKIEAAADADELGIHEEQTLDERFHRGDAPRRGPGRPRKEPPPSAWSAPAPAPLPPTLAPKTPGRILSQRFTSGTETLNLKLMWCAAWAKTYRVTVGHVDGKTRRTGVLAHLSTESDGRREMETRVAEAREAGWVEAAGRSDGALTSIPVPKARKGRA